MIINADTVEIPNGKKQNYSVDRYRIGIEFTEHHGNQMDTSVVRTTTDNNIHTDNVNRQCFYVSVDDLWNFKVYALRCHNLE